jgi:hypothetical protein
MRECLAILLCSDEPVSYIGQFYHCLRGDLSCAHEETAARKATVREKGGGVQRVVTLPTSCWMTAAIIALLWRFQ